MNTIVYSISNIDVYYYADDTTDIKAKVDAEERGRKMLREIKSLFPNRDRITEHGPYKPDGFAMMGDTGKSYTYHDPNCIIKIYKKFQKIPRRGESINFLEVIVSSGDYTYIDNKKKAIEEIIEKYNAETGNKLKVEPNEYRN